MSSGSVDVMRMSAWLLTGVFASSGVMPAIAGSAYSKCAEAANPAECIARRAVGSADLEPEGVLEGVLRHGLVDLVPDQSRKLMRGLYDSVGEPGKKMDTPVEQLLDSTAAQSLRKSPRKSVLAAMALVAASRRDIDPFSNPIYLRLAREAKNDPRIPALSLGLWIEIVAMSGSPPDFWVTHVGLKSIWDRAVARKEKDAVLLEDIAGTLVWFDELKPKAQEFFLWYAQQPALTPYQRIGVASELAELGLPDQAATLMEGIRDDMEGYDVPAVRAKVAAARLAKGYDAKSARLLAAVMLNDLIDDGGRLSSLDEKERDALERSGARDELRMLGSECLKVAEAAGRDGASANWYAAASEFYLLAGDRELAREIARRGLPYVPALVRQATHPLTNIDEADPTAMAVAAQGKGTEPVIALYRTGAIEEALKTGYLAGNDRYVNAGRAGEKKDPQWVIDDEWPLYIIVMSGEAERSADREFQQRAYDGLVRSCGKPLADCFDETLRQIARVAAGMGDESRMKEALAAAARQLDEDEDDLQAFSALYVAGPWAHCEEVLRAAKLRDQ